MTPIFKADIIPAAIKPNLVHRIRDSEARKPEKREKYRCTSGYVFIKSGWK